MREIQTQIEINAPAERVWEILTDVRRYPEWNPFITRIEGVPAEGSASGFGSSRPEPRA